MYLFPCIIHLASSQGLLIPSGSSKISTPCLSSDAGPGHRNDKDDTILEWLEGGKLGKALLRRYDDSAEACRELAVETLTELMQVSYV